MWGALDEEGLVGNCCFTSHEVTTPVALQHYMGQPAIEIDRSGLLDEHEEGI